jgi:hypothetical protein
MHSGDTIYGMVKDTATGRAATMSLAKEESAATQVAGLRARVCHAAGAELVGDRFGEPDPLLQDRDGFARFSQGHQAPPRDHLRRGHGAGSIHLGHGGGRSACTASSLPAQASRLRLLTPDEVACDMRYGAARRPPHGVLNPAGADHQSANRAGVLASGLDRPLRLMRKSSLFASRRRTCSRRLSPAGIA